MFADMKTGTKIILGYGFAVAIALMIGFLGYRGISSATSAIDDAAHDRVPSIRALAAIHEGLAQIDGAENALLSTALAGRDREEKYAVFDEVKQEIDGAWKTFESLPKTPEEAAGWREFVSTWDKWWRDHAEFVRLAREHDRDRTPENYAKMSNQALAVSDASYKPVSAQIDKLIEVNNEEAESDAKLEEEQARANIIIMFSAIALGALVLFSFGLLISRSIAAVLKSLIDESRRLTAAAVNGQLDTRGNPNLVTPEFRGIVVGVNETLDAVVKPLKVAANYVERISRGDIPEKITDKYNGDFNEIKSNLNTCVEIVNNLLRETAQLIKAANAGDLTARADPKMFNGGWKELVEGVNKMLEPFHDSFIQVADAIDQVSGASTQIAEGSQSVSQGASEQASAIEETSSSLEEITGQTKQNADSAQQANALAQGMKASAEKGRAAMEQMAASMLKIRDASATTSQIIRDINEISFQTNLLALNAAVEAARAGEAGRGFAVVAEEVRSLAQRSKEAAGKTEALINESVRLTGEGESISKEVNNNLVEIVASVVKVTGLVEEMASSSIEQSRGLEQLNKAMSQMDQVVQQNVSNAEESSGAAEELASQAEQLAGMVGRFKLSREASSRPALKQRPMKAAPHVAHAPLLPHKAGDATAGPAKDF